MSFHVPQFVVDEDTAVQSNVNSALDNFIQSSRQANASGSVRTFTLGYNFSKIFAAPNSSYNISSGNSPITPLPYKKLLLKKVYGFVQTNIGGVVSFPNFTLGIQNGTAAGAGALCDFIPLGTVTFSDGTQPQAQSRITFLLGNVNNNSLDTEKYFFSSDGGIQLFITIPGAFAINDSYTCNITMEWQVIE